MSNALKADIKKILSLNSVTDLRKFVQDESTYKRAYLALNTADAEYSVGKYHWKLNNTNMKISGNVVSANKEIKNIIGMKICGVNAMAELKNPAYYNICLEEFSHDSFIASTGRRFHFIYNCTGASNLIEMNFFMLYTGNIYYDYSARGSVIGYNDGYFWFSKKIEWNGDLTISVQDFNGNSVLIPDRIINLEMIYL